MQDNNQFIGVFAILMLTAVAIVLTREVASTPEFTSALGALNGWAGAHATTLGFVAAGTIAVVGISLPVVLSHRDSDGGERVAAVGRTASSYAMAILCVASIPAIAYLIGMGVFAAKAAFNG
jgi:hypothetical protein